MPFTGRADSTGYLIFLTLHLLTPEANFLVNQILGKKLVLLDHTERSHLTVNWFGHVLTHQKSRLRTFSKGGFPSLMLFFRENLCTGFQNRS